MNGISYVTGGICSHHPFMGSVSLLPFVAIKVYGSPWLTLCLPLSVAKDIQLTPRGNPNLNDALFSESFWMQLALPALCVSLVAGGVTGCCEVWRSDLVDGWETLLHGPDPAH